MSNYGREWDNNIRNNNAKSDYQNKVYNNRNYQPEKLTPREDERGRYEESLNEGRRYNNRRDNLPENRVQYDRESEEKGRRYEERRNEGRYDRDNLPNRGAQYDQRERGRYEDRKYEDMRHGNLPENRAAQYDESEKKRIEGRNYEERRNEGRYDDRRDVENRGEYDAQDRGRYEDTRQGNYYLRDNRGAQHGDRGNEEKRSEERGNDGSKEERRNEERRNGERSNEARRFEDRRFDDRRFEGRRFEDRNHRDNRNELRSAREWERRGSNDSWERDNWERDRGNNERRDSRDSRGSMGDVARRGSNNSDNWERDRENRDSWEGRKDSWGSPGWRIQNENKWDDVTRSPNLQGDLRSSVGENWEERDWDKIVQRKDRNYSRDERTGEKGNTAGGGQTRGGGESNSREQDREGNENRFREQERDRNREFRERDQNNNGSRDFREREIRERDFRERELRERDLRGEWNNKEREDRERDGFRDNRERDSGREGYRNRDENRDDRSRDIDKEREGYRDNREGFRSRERQEDRPQDPLLHFKRLLKVPLKNQHSMRKLVLAAASVPDMEAIVLELGEPNGANLEKLNEIISSQFSVDAGTRAFPVSFQRVVLPLLTLITNTRFEAVPFPAALRRIYSVFYSNSSFVFRVLDCIAVMAKRRSLSDQGYTSMASMESDDEAWLPATGCDVIEPVISLILIFLSKFTDAIVDSRIPAWLQELESYFRTWDSQATAAVQRIRSKFQRAESMVVPPAEKSSELKKAGRPRDPLKLVMDPRIGPGNIRPQGPRHDNDFEDFRKISIIPTKDEIFCLEQPYLPKINSNLSHLPKGVDMLLDSHFRLMRDDSLAAVRRGLSSFLHNDGMKALGKTGSFFRDRSGSVDLLVFRNVNVVTIEPSLWKGIGVVLKFSQPKKVESMNDAERDKYWSFGGGSRQLQIGSLVCLWLQAGASLTKSAAEQKIFFGVVSQRKKITESNKIGEIEVRMLNHEHIIEATKELSAGDQTNNKGESILLQVRGHFFTSTESVLNSLQMHTEATLPFVESFAHGRATLRPPEYITPQVTKFDLSALVKQDMPDREEIVRQLRNVTLGDYKQLKRTLEKVADKIILDPTQAQALAASLSHEVSLIQGPPGTGKTYIGIHLVNILLQNSSKPQQLAAARYPSLLANTSANDNVLTPIVCICYTNHALDQFLEGVIANGLPATEVVRVGGRSKSEVLLNCNLKDLAYQNISPTESYRRGMLKGEAEAIENDIRDYAVRKQKKKVSYHDIKEFLQFHYENHHYNIISRASKTSGKLPKLNQSFLAETESAVFDIWISGKDLNIKKSSKQPPANPPSVPLSSGFVGLTIEEGKKESETEDKEEEEVDEEESEGEEEEDDSEDEEEEDYEESEDEEESEEDEEDEKDEGKGEEEEGTENPQSEENQVAPTTRNLEDLMEAFLWSLTLPERKILYNHWISHWKEEQEEMFISKCATYERIRQEIKGYTTSCELRALRGASVVGFTTSGAAAHQQLFRSLGARIVICEEAGEVFESHILSSLTQNTQHLIMIGDHKQLRPKVEEYDLSVDAGFGYDLDLSLFERMVHAREKEFGKVGAMDNGSLVTLETQRRMRPEISNLIRIPIYPNLKDAPEVLNYPPVLGMARNLWFFDHNNPETGGKEAESRSYVNIFEAEMILVLVKHLVRQGYQPIQIAVLTPYAGQLLKLRDLLSKAQMAIFIDERTLQDISKAVEVDAGDEFENEGDEFFVDSDDEAERAKPKKKRNDKVKNVKVKDCVRLSTVDNFQGEEADVVIVSTVRSNSQGKTGFLQISNRVNVMMSRAKHGMYVFGSSATVDASRNAHVFRAMLAELRKQDAIGKYLPLRCKRHGTDLLVESPTEFASKVPDGGCDEPCGTRLACGHACQRMCHPDDSQHVGFSCRQPCTRLHSPCGHPCANMCFQECGKCYTKVPVQLPCGHAATIDCHRTKNISAVHCIEKVEVQYPFCGHKVLVSCGAAINLQARLTTMRAGNNMLLDPDPIFGCPVNCSTLQPHQKQALSPPLPCGHPCTQSCGKCCESTIRIEDITVDISQTIQKKHHSGACTLPCNRPLVCGHSCAATSCHGASECPPCTKQCSIKCPHTKCGRVCVEPCPPCAEPCVWYCAHRGGCPLPCGSPCIRLPCDNKCTKILSCGHPCPSVCGEICPPSDRACPNCALPNYRNSVIDLIEMKTLDTHDSSKGEPLVALECGHTFTISTLDGTLGLETAYTKNSRGDWNELLELPSKLGVIPSCPHCREPITNIRRYGRILTHVAMEQAAIKFSLQTQNTCRQYARFLEQYDRDLSEYEASDPRDFRDTRDINDARDKMRFTCEKTRDLCANLKKFQPERRVYEMSVAALLKKSIANFPPFIPPSAQPLIIALQISVSALTYKFRYDCLFFLSKITHHGEPRRTKGPSQPPKTLAETVQDSLGRVRSTVENVCRLARELLKLCATSKSFRSLQDSQALFVKFLYFSVFHTQKIARAARHDENSKFSMRQLHNTIKIMEDVVADISNQEERRRCRLIVEEATKMISSEHYEIVTMEEKQSIFTAMSSDVGTGTGNFGGHWFMCRHGHVYTIGECGGAMEQGVCPECGSTIGGLHHQREEDNKVATEFLGQVNP